MLTRNFPRNLFKKKMEKVSIKIRSSVFQARKMVLLPLFFIHFAYAIKSSYL